jgi:hypothetical protein
LTLLAAQDSQLWQGYALRCSSCVFYPPQQGLCSSGGLPIQTAASRNQQYVHASTPEKDVGLE